MRQNEKIKLFISYSHIDENKVKEFIKHITPFKSNGLIEEWYDRKIIAGQDFQNTIDNNLDSADIICLFISANFLSSEACLREKNNALKIMKNKGISVIPIILSACAWLDCKEISSLLALPTDGMPISNFSDPDSAWLNVYNGLKNVIEKENIIKQLEIIDEFKLFLINTELLTKSHSNKTDIFLEDIFVYPELEKYDDSREYEKKDSSEKLIDNFYECSKILIAGENQSGKTTLCKKIFIELRKKNFVPIYIHDKSSQFQGQIENRIIKAFKEQYNSNLFKEIDKERIVLIIDDFHFANKKEKHIYDLNTYCHQVIIVDDIFSLNFKDENLMKSFNHFKIKQFSPSLRNKLIEKWINLSDINSTSNKLYKDIDATTELVNSTLGKVFSSGIMPAYPFFILSIISTFDTFDKPLDREITSQGYCYQALIYLYLRKQGVKNDEIDTYINFLTEFAFYIFKEKKQELSENDFNVFMKEHYLKKYNLPIKKEIILDKLQTAKIINLDSCNNYSFCYSYPYYFFVAKYFAEHSEENKKPINSIINNLHKNENAYIAIFISHHSKNIYLLDEIILNAMLLFHKFKPATLTKEELDFFDDKQDNIVKAILPPKSLSPEKARNKRLKNQDIMEQINENEEKQKNIEEEEDISLAKEIRRSVKTVEVMGVIIKNRAGSLEKEKLENVFEEAMNIYLRILTSFFELIKDEKHQNILVDFIKNKLDIVIKEKNKKENKGENKELSQEQLEKLSKTIFWNMNFSVVFNFINKIIHSLGSDKLQSITDKVCNDINTPASFLVKHGILMWYSKNLQTDNIANRINEEDGFSETAKKIMKFIIVNHCAIHQMGFKEIQKIEQKLKIPSQRLIMTNKKDNE